MHSIGKMRRHTVIKINKGSKVFITGAASGIGRATAMAMGRLGCRLFLTDINSAGLEETVRMISQREGDVCMYRPLDIAQYDQVKAFANDIHCEFGPLDILVNNAGISLYALVEDMSHEHWQRVINVNLWGPIHGVECFLPEMIRAKKGHVVTVSSIAGLVGWPFHAAYSSAKWGLVGLSEVLRYDLMQHNIGVTVVCPGAVETPLKNSVEILGIDPDSPKVKELKERFSRHAVSPERVAELIVDAVERNRYLVVTSFDIRLLYFLKCHVSPLYHRVMIMFNRLIQDARSSGQN